MSTSDCWEVTMKGTLLSNDCDNVFFYRGVAGTDPPEDDIAQAFYEQCWPLIQDVVSSDYTLDAIEVRHLFSGASAYLLPVAENGQGGSGATMGSFEAYSITLGVGTNSTRPGSKRFGGVEESLVHDGVVSDATAITDLNDIADQMSEPLIDTALGIVEWAVPVIVKRILDGSSYRLPTSLGELVTNLITSAAASLLISTQNSRKTGYGT